MEHSKRFTDAVTKLYNAFHNDELNPFNCKACAVGSIVGSDRWDNFWVTQVKHGDARNLRQTITQGITLKTKVFTTGYNVSELMRVEELFLNEFERLTLARDKESQFRGLCAVVEYLCELEGIPNVMDYSRLFETENDAPKHQLQEVFV